MKKLLFLFVVIVLSFGAFSQEEDNLFYIILGNKSLLEDNGLLLLYPIKPTKMFIGTNEEKYSFLDTVSWSYSESFNIGRNFLKRKYVTLYVQDVFGIAKFYLNNKLVLETNNGFISYELDVKKFLKPESNTIRVEFNPIVSTLNYDNNNYNTLSSENQIFTL